MDGTETNNNISWLNAKDSLLHALDHFFELSDKRPNKWHHQKWIILSVHHAASCLVSMWLKEADNNHKLFRADNGKDSYPHLDETIKALQKFKGTNHLTDAEHELLTLLKRLNDIRNKFMHRRPPKQVGNEVVAYAATSMVGLLHVVSRRTNQSFYEIFGEFPDIRRFIMGSIHYSKIEEYSTFIEKVLADQGEKYILPQCPSCGTQSIIGFQCEACFEEVSKAECSQCNNEFYIISSCPFSQECPDCGYEYKA